MPALAAKHHLTEEEAGRRVRYETFEYEAKKRGASVIAVAHHMDDQAETVLMNLLRGSGIRGCSGIPCKRSLSDKGDIVVVRPLLGMRREEIEAWLIESGQEWCIDEKKTGCRNQRRQRNSTGDRAAFPASKNRRDRNASCIHERCRDYGSAGIGTVDGRNLRAGRRCL